MAAISNVRIVVDDFLKDTRLTICDNRNCKFIRKDSLQCQLKEIELNEHGVCSMMELHDE